MVAYANASEILFLGLLIAAFVVVGGARKAATRRAVVAALAAAMLLAVTRVAVGIHYPTDVLAGAAIGTLAALILHQTRVRVLLHHLADISRHARGLRRPRNGRPARAHALLSASLGGRIDAPGRSCGETEIRPPEAGGQVAFRCGAPWWLSSHRLTPADKDVPPCR